MMNHMAMADAVDTTASLRWMDELTRVLGVLLLVLLLAIAAVWLIRQPMFQLTELRLDGDLKRNNIPTVQANVMSHLQGSQGRYFGMDLAASRQVFENLPWVRQAVVRRVWPNALHVTLQEHQPAAYWQTGEREDLMVNQQGEVFEANTGDVDDDNLPTFISPTGPTPAHAQQMLAMYRQLTPLFSRMNASIDTLKLTDRGSWSVKLDGNADIELGRGQTAEVLARCERFVTTFAHFKEQTRQQYAATLVYADLRYPRGYAVKLRGITTMQTNSESASVNSNAIPLNSSKPD